PAFAPRERSPLPATVREVPAAAVPPSSSPVAHGAPETTPTTPNPFQHVGGRFLQVMDLYLLLEGPQGLLVVDQHALHERVVYERLVRQHQARAVKVQRLLTPTVVEVTPQEQAWLVEMREALQQEGLLV